MDTSVVEGSPEGSALLVHDEWVQVPHALDDDDDSIVDGSRDDAPIAF